MNAIYIENFCIYGLQLQKRNICVQLHIYKERHPAKKKGFTCGSYFVGSEREVSMDPKANDEIA